MSGTRALIFVAVLLAACDVSSQVDPTGGVERRGGRTQAQWRAEAQGLERRVESLEQQIEAAREQIWALPASFDRSVSAQEARLESKIEGYQAQIDDLEGRLATLQRDATRAGVPPGWLR